MCSFEPQASPSLHHKCGRTRIDPALADQTTLADVVLANCSAERDGNARDGGVG
jgi:hypothetical protein